ncbi:MAG: ral nucleoside transport system permease protein [Clostridia bacterium]|jgi:simple sugar transport system permease protein|nr:ral nucleoside transport system permease protein [Clostridia bacterium]MDN5322811.1 ral nucleoside transport system permease protein [Clostridia bacterium]
MLYKFVKRSEITQRKSIEIRTVAILLALLVSALFILILDLNPLEVYLAMIKGAFGSSYRIKQTIINTIPLVITSLGIAIAFKMKFWNIGAEGQIMMGAFAASFFALRFPELPPFLLLPLMMVAGIIGGGLWAVIPAFFKAQWETNETIVTLMMNYIALKWVTYLQYGPWRDQKALGFPKIPNFSENAILPNVFGVHIGWIFALVLIVLTYIFMNHSKLGFEIAVLGESDNTARYAGINIKKTIVIALLISGGLSGLTGVIQASAVSNTLNVEISGGIGYTAIITTWLGSLSAPLILLVSILFAALIQGGSFIQTAFGIPEAAALILEGMILFFVLGSEFFVKYKLVKNVVYQPVAGKEEV